MAPSHEVTVTVLDHASPAPGADVVFHDNDGTVVATMKADAQGKASAIVPAGGMVSMAIIEDDGTRIVYTMTGLNPDDDITLGNGVRTNDGAVTLQVSLPSAVENATIYRINVGCAIENAIVPSQPGVLTIPMALPHDCVGDDLAMLVVATDPMGSPLAYGFKTGISVPGSAAIDAWKTTWKSVDATLHDAPAGMTGAWITAGVSFGGRRFTMAPSFAPIVAGSAMTQVRVPSDFGTSLGYDADLGFADPNQLVQLVDWSSDVSNSIVIDGSQVPAPLSAPRVDAADPARPSVSLASGANVTGDVVALGLHWGDPKQPSYFWTVFVPPDVGTATIPALPEALAGYRPQTTNLAGGVMSYDDADLDGWDAIRDDVPAALRDKHSRLVIFGFLAD